MSTRVTQETGALSVANARCSKCYSCALRLDGARFLRSPEGLGHGEAHGGVAGSLCAQGTRPRLRLALHLAMPGAGALECERTLVRCLGCIQACPQCVDRHEALPDEMQVIAVLCDEGGETPNTPFLSLTEVIQRGVAHGLRRKGWGELGGWNAQRLRHVGQHLGLRDVAAFSVERVLDRLQIAPHQLRPVGANRHHGAAGRFGVVHEARAVKRRVRVRCERLAAGLRHLAPVAGKLIRSFRCQRVGGEWAQPAHHHGQAQRRGIARLIQKLVQGLGKSVAPGAHGVGDVKEFHGHHANQPADSLPPAGVGGAGMQYAGGFASRSGPLKTYQIELQKIKAMAHRTGLIEARIDALVLANPGRGENNLSTTLSMSEETARVLFLLLKQQLAEIDGRKARSQR